MCESQSYPDFTEALKLWMIEMRTFRLHFNFLNAANLVRIGPLAVLSLCAKLM